MIGLFVSLKSDSHINTNPNRLFIRISDWDGAHHPNINESDSSSSEKKDDIGQCSLSLQNLYGANESNDSVKSVKIWLPLEKPHKVNTFWKRI